MKKKEVVKKLIDLAVDSDHAQNEFDEAVMKLYGGGVSPEFAAKGTVVSEMCIGYRVLATIFWFDNEEGENGDYVLEILNNNDLSKEEKKEKLFSRYLEKAPKD